MPYYAGIEANETGHETMLDRVRAFRKLILELSEFMDEEEITEGAVKFVNEWWEKLECVEDDDELGLGSFTVSAKQYFWAKDLYDEL